MAFVNYTASNLAQGLLNAGIGASATTVVLQTGQGGLFPSTFPFLAVIEKYDGQSRVTQREMVKVTNRSGDTLTVVRSAGSVPAAYNSTTQGTTAFAFDSGDALTHIVSAEQIKDIQDEIVAKLSKSGGVMTGQMEQAKGTNIASAATVDLGASTGNFAHITGTTTITSLGSSASPGTQMEVVFDGILILTHNATSLILPTSANITTAVGDTATFICESTGNWKCAMYQRASGQPLVAPTVPDIHGRQLFTASGTFNVPTGVSTVYVSMCGGGGGSGGYRGAGGGGAASVFHQSQAVTPGAAITVTIGAAGTGGVGSGNGTAGGNSSFGAFITTNGGGGGAYAGGAGGAAGGTGGTAGQVGNGNEGAGKGGDGGSCHFGHGGSAEYKTSSATSGTSQPGSGFGAGGGGGPWNANGTNGSPGMCLVEW